MYGALNSQLSAHDAPSRSDFVTGFILLSCCFRSAPAPPLRADASDEPAYCVAIAVAQRLVLRLHRCRPMLLHHAQPLVQARHSKLL